MMIDRTKALLLVGALAATGCVIKKSDDGAAGGTGGSGASAGTAGNGGSAGATGGSAGTTGGTAGATGGSAGTTGGTGGATGGTAGATGGTAGATGGTGGLACDDSVGTPDCSEFPVWAEGECDGRAMFCDGLTGKVKPARQVEAIDCLRAMTDPCDDSAAYSCVGSALANSCNVQDDGTSAACNVIVLDCARPVEQADCEAYTNALTEEGAGIFLECMADYCDVYTCSEALPFTTANQ